MLRQTLSKIFEVRAAITPHLANDGTSNLQRRPTDQRYLTTSKREQETSEQRKHENEARCIGSSGTTELVSKQCSGCIPMCQYGTSISNYPNSLKDNKEKYDFSSAKPTEDGDYKDKADHQVVKTGSSEPPGRNDQLVKTSEKENVSPGVVGVLTPETEDCGTNFQDTPAANSSPIVVFKKITSCEPNDENEIIQKVVENIMPNIDQDVYRDIYGHLVVDALEMKVESEECKKFNKQSVKSIETEFDNALQSEDEMGRELNYPNHDYFNGHDNIYVYPTNSEPSKRNLILDEGIKNLEDADNRPMERSRKLNASEQMLINSSMWNQVISPELRKYVLPEYVIPPEITYVKKEQKQEKVEDMETIMMKTIQSQITNDNELTRSEEGVEDERIESTNEALLHRLCLVTFIPEISFDLDRSHDANSITSKYISTLTTPKYNSPSCFFRKSPKGPKGPTKTPTDPPEKCLPLRRVLKPSDKPNVPLNCPPPKCPTLPRCPPPPPHPCPVPYAPGCPASEPVYTSPATTPNPKSEPDYPCSIPIDPIDLPVPQPSPTCPAAPSCPQFIPMHNPQPFPGYEPFPAPETPPCPCPLPSNPYMSPSKDPCKPHQAPAKSAPSECPPRPKAPKKTSRPRCPPEPKSAPSKKPVCIKQAVPSACQCSSFECASPSKNPSTQRGFRASPESPERKKYLPWEGVSEKQQFSKFVKKRFASRRVNNKNPNFTPCSPTDKMGPQKPFSPQNFPWAPPSPGIAPSRHIPNIPPPKPIHPRPYVTPFKPSLPNPAEQSPNPAVPFVTYPLSPKVPKPYDPQYRDPKQIPDDTQYSVPNAPSYGPSSPAYNVPNYPKYNAPKNPQYSVPNTPTYSAPEQPYIPSAPNFTIPSPSQNPEKPKNQPYPLPMVPLPNPSWIPPTKPRTSEPEPNEFHPNPFRTK